MYDSYKLEEEKYYVSLGMRKYGGSFIQYLGEALAHADIFNTKKIKETWPEYWQDYLEIGKRISQRASNSVG